MIRKALLSFIFIFYLSQPRAELIKGFDSDGNLIACMFNNTINVLAMDGGKVLHACFPVQDTSLKGRMFRKLKAMNQGAKKEDLIELKNSLDRLSLVNLTVRKNKVYAGIRFYEKAYEKSKLGHAILQYSDKLELEYFFILARRDNNFFSLLNYNPLEFLNDTTICLVESTPDNLDVSAYIMNKKTCKLLYGYNVRQTIELNNFWHIGGVERAIMEPKLYAMKNSRYAYYYQYPLPVIFKSKDTCFNDIMGLKYKTKMDRHSLQGSGGGLLFNRQVLMDTFVLMATWSDKDSVRYLVSSPDPNYLMYFKAVIQNGSYQFSHVKIPYKNTYFVLLKNKVLYLRRNGEELEFGQLNI